ncbi:hypothetical protein ACFVT2_36440 [Streptomyces sp. NPDC058000]|uniref:hypothetical protein n=1 Tax=Streptomyces sp. NPDC058000 TaxID=3346299 RepID=UPI0036EB49E0
MVTATKTRRTTSTINGEPPLRQQPSTATNRFPEDWWWTLIVIELLAAGLITGIHAAGIGAAANAGVIYYFLAASRVPGGMRVAPRGRVGSGPTVPPGQRRSLDFLLREFSVPGGESALRTRGLVDWIAKIEVKAAGCSLVWRRGEVAETGAAVIEITADPPPSRRHTTRTASGSETGTEGSE